MKDIKHPVILDKEARADAPASFVDGVHPKSNKCQGKMGIFVAGVVTGVLTMAVASEMVNELNSSYDLKME